MKTILSRILITTILSPSLILLTVSPALAVINSDITPAACLHVITLRSAGRDAMATNLAKMNKGFSDRMKKIASNKASVDKKVTTSRANAKNLFESKLKKLESKAGWTSAQKQAIATYKTNMELAKTTRDLAVDTARTNYRSALANLITAQQKDLTAAVITYQKAFEKAFATANANCSKGANMSAVKTAVQSAHQTLKTAITKANNKDKIKQLATTRNNAIKSADDTFIKQAASYTKTLKIALGLDT